MCNYPVKLSQELSTYYQLTFLSLVFRLDGMGVEALAGVTLGFTMAGGGVVTLMSNKCG